MFGGDDAGTKIVHQKLLDLVDLLEILKRLILCLLHLHSGPKVIFLEKNLIRRQSCTLFKISHRLKLGHFIVYIL